MAGIAILNAFQIGRLRYDAPMLDRPHVDAIAAKVARIHLPAGALLSVASQPYEGPYGGAELMVTIKISDALFSDVTGRQFTQIKLNSYSNKLITYVNIGNHAKKIYVELCRLLTMGCFTSPARMLRIHLRGRCSEQNLLALLFIEALIMGSFAKYAWRCNYLTARSTQ